MPFICNCQKIYNDKTFKFELYFDSYKSSTEFFSLPFETFTSCKIFIHQD